MSAAYAPMYIDGRPVAGERPADVAVLNPATEQVLGCIGHASEAEIAATLQSAARGFEAWRNTRPWDRSLVLRRIAANLRQRQDALVACLCEEVGKPIAEAMAEVQTSADFFDWYADEARRIEGSLIAGRDARSQIGVHWEPVGVTLALTAWNFPIVLAARKLAMALAAGCAVILRPADEAPASASGLVSCCIDAGLPAGALNLVFGSPETVVQPLLASPTVRKVSFTGSTAVGRILAAQCAASTKRLTMELGGHAPFIVMEDADVDRAAELAAAAKFRNAGQVCTSPSRFFVHEQVKARFVDGFVRQAENIRVGMGSVATTHMGPLATARQLKHCERLVDDALARGARLRTGGQRPAGLQSGYFYAPTVLDDVPADAAILLEEPFCPVAAIVGVSSRQEAIARANASGAGLAGYLFTRSLEHIATVQRELECGVIGINNVSVGYPETPFGGVKDSGYGREGGAIGLRDYLATKMVHCTW